MTNIPRSKFRTGTVECKAEIESYFGTYETDREQTRIWGRESLTLEMKLLEVGLEDDASTRSEDIIMLLPKFSCEITNTHKVGLIFASHPIRHQETIHDDQNQSSYD